MNIMLDTHVLLWWLDNPRLLTDEARKAISNGQNTVFISAAVVWEITIKKSINKLEAPDNLEEAMTEERFLPLPITQEHVLVLPELPDIHNDPFDRIQAAQAHYERFRLVTRDKHLKKYGIPFILA